MHMHYTWLSKTCVGSLSYKCVASDPATLDRQAYQRQLSPPHRLMFSEAFYWTVYYLHFCLDSQYFCFNIRLWVILFSQIYSCRATSQSIVGSVMGWFKRVICVQTEHNMTKTGTKCFGQLSFVGIKYGQRSLVCHSV